MSRRVKLIIMLVVLVLFCLIASRPLIDWLGQRKPAAGQTVEAQLNAERCRLMAPDHIVKLINPKPAGTVVDLGAGFGLFTFSLAKAVGENGRVFATDTDSRIIAHLAERIKKEGVKNVTPVRVQPDGLDHFYREHMFDVILVSDVISLIPAPELFFSQLNPCLREGSGRLWVVDMRLDPDFTPFEFADAGALRKALLSHGADSSLLRRLGPRVRDVLAAQSSSPTDETLCPLVVEELNRMLDDPTLWPEAQSSKWPLNQRESEVRQALSMTLEKAGVFTSRNGAGSISVKGPLRLLNRLVLQDMLQSEQWEKAFSLDRLDRSQWAPLLARLSAGQDYQALFLKAGYSLVQEHSGLAYHNIWEFKRKS